MYKTFFLKLIFFLVLSHFIFSTSSAHSQPEQNKLIHIDIHHEGKQTKIRFKMTTHANFHRFILEKPLRLVVDLSQTFLASKEKPEILPQYLVNKIRIAPKTDGTLRLVFDLKESTFIEKVDSLDDEHLLIITLKQKDNKKNENKNDNEIHVVLLKTELESEIKNEENQTLNKQKISKNLDHTLPDDDVKDFQDELKKIQDPNSVIKNSLLNETSEKVSPTKKTLEPKISQAPVEHHFSKESDSEEFTEILATETNELNSYNVKTKPREGKIIVVIDPGHGGKDPGATGPHGIQEKNVVLAISKVLQKQINANPLYTAKLTRSGDYYLTLRQRLKVARKDKADFFIAIHADAYMNNDADGASVYALSQSGATSEAARWMADQENYSELGEVKGFNGKSYLVRSVLLDLSQTVTISQSLQIGYVLLHALKNVTSLHHAIVEQARFVVLKSPDIPSLLVETGFITNPREEARLSSSTYQAKLANALSEGIFSYFKAHPPQAINSTEEQVIPKTKLHLYQVKSHDSIKTIAKQFKISISALKEANHLKTNLVKTGQTLKIPTESEEASDDT